MASPHSPCFYQSSANKHCMHGILHLNHHGCQQNSICKDCNACMLCTMPCQAKGQPHQHSLPVSRAHLQQFASFASFTVSSCPADEHAQHCNLLLLACAAFEAWVYLKASLHTTPNAVLSSVLFLCCLQGHVYVSMLPAVTVFTRMVDDVTNLRWKACKGIYM